MHRRKNCNTGETISQCRSRICTFPGYQCCWGTLSRLRLQHLVQGQFDMTRLCREANGLWWWNLWTFCSWTSSATWPACFLLRWVACLCCADTIALVLPDQSIVTMILWMLTSLVLKFMKYEFLLVLLSLSVQLQGRRQGFWKHESKWPPILPKTIQLRLLWTDN